jgi:protein TonB
LRKQYAGRLGIALISTIAGVFLIMMIIKSSYSVAINSILVPKDEVIIKTVYIPEPPHQPVIEPIIRQSAQAATQQYTNIDIVPDHEAETSVPANDVLIDKQIAIETKDGLLNMVPPVQEKGAGDQTTIQPVLSEPKHTFDPVELQPQFPGGPQAWTAFLQRHLRVPEELEPGSKKTVLVRFMVSGDGSITDFEIVQSGGSAFDNEVIRVLKKMPRWNPAVQNGRTISLSFMQPVTFQAFEE